MASTYIDFKAPVLALAACAGAAPAAAAGGVSTGRGAKVARGGSASAAGAAAGSGAFVLAAGGGGSAKTGIHNYVNVYVLRQTEKGLPILEEVSSNSTGDGAVSKIAVSNQGTLIATSVAESADCRLYNFDIRRKVLGEPTRTWKTDFSAENPEQLLSCFDATGTRVATAGEDGTIRVWPTKVAGPAPSASFTRKAHTKSVSGLCFHPRQPILASCARDGSIQLMNTSSTAAVDIQGYGAAAAVSVKKRGRANDKWSYRAVRFTSDGKILYALESSNTGPCAILKFESEDGSWPLNKPPTPSKVKVLVDGPAGAMAISEDGSQIAVGTGGGFILVLDDKLNLRMRKEVHGLAVTSVEILPFADTSAVVSGGADSCVAVTAYHQNVGATAKIVYLLLALVFAVLAVLLRPYLA